MAQMLILQDRIFIRNLLIYLIVTKRHTYEFFTYFTFHFSAK